MTIRIKTRLTYKVEYHRASDGRSTITRAMSRGRAVTICRRLRLAGHTAAVIAVRSTQRTAQKDI